MDSSQIEGGYEESLAGDFPDQHPDLEELESVQMDEYPDLTELEGMYMDEYPDLAELEEMYMGDVS